jgi:hypothetical protein
MIGSIIYPPDFGDAVAAGRFLKKGNQRCRSPEPLTTFETEPDLHDQPSNLGQYVMHDFDTAMQSFAFIGDVDIKPSDTPRIPSILLDRSDKLNSIPILDDRYPAVERLDNTSPPFRILRRGIITSLVHRSRYVATLELLRFYLGDIIAPALQSHVLSQLPEDSSLIPWVKFCPSNTALYIVTKAVDKQLFYCNHTRHHKHSSIARCHLTTQLPTTDDWKSSYALDKDTNYLIGRITTDKTPLSEHEIRNVHESYRHALRENRIHFRNNRLLLFTSIASSHRFLCLIIVPESLRQLVFFAYHASGSGAHMGAFKTLLLIRTRFFWPRMRKLIMAWVKGCAGCIPTAVRNREGTGLLHTWPITTPFAILSVDMWKPGEVVNADGYIALLNAMCDMTQFIVSAPVRNLEATHVARAFMEAVLLKFGLCLMVVVDEGKEFCGLFRSMCRHLNIRCHVVAKRNHKAVGVERYHRFLNHAQRICAEERGTPASFVECGMTTAYAWNASPIDGTEIIRSVPAIGRALRFSLDVHETDMPLPIDDPATSVVQYVRYLGNDVSFARNLLAWLIADRREAHRERENSKRSPILYKVGDIVMGRVAVQSNKERGVSQKMVYQSRGPYVIEKVTGYDTYFVRKYGKPLSALQKFMASDLYLLPPQIYRASMWTRLIYGT